MNGNIVATCFRRPTSRRQGNSNLTPIVWLAGGPGDLLDVGVGLIDARVDDGEVLADEFVAGAAAGGQAQDQDGAGQQDGTGEGAGQGDVSCMGRGANPVRRADAPHEPLTAMS